MKIGKNKAAAIMIATLLIISIGASTILLPNASAHTPAWQIPTESFINVAPDPVGVGQTVTVNFWLQEPPPTAGTIYGDRWTNMSVLVTKPDGTTQTLGPFTSDDTGGTFTIFTPTQTGNYSFQMLFGGQTLAGANLSPVATSAVKAFIGDYYQPSKSEVITVSVQAQPVSSAPITPLPSNYWQTPVNAQNVNQWYSISGAWLGLGLSTFANTGMYNLTGDYNPYTTAPNSAHIMWTKPEAFGGVLGGEFGNSETSNYYATSQYEPKFAPIIMNGILYYTQYPGSSSNPAGWVAVDLYTGKTLWTVNTTTILRCGQILDYVTPNQYGGLAYLWSTGNPLGSTVLSTTAINSLTYNLWDAMTGNYILSIVNGTSLQLTEDQGGNLVGYFVNTTNPNQPMLSMWNSTQCIVTATNGLAAWQWRPTQGAQIDFGKGIMWSAPLNTTYQSGALPSVLSISAVNSGVVILTAAGSAGGSYFQSGYQIEAAYSANDGSLLWITNRTETPFTRIVMGSTLASNNVFVEVNQDTMTAVGYSMTAGSQLWSTKLTGPNGDFNAYDSDGINEVVANGTLYLWGLGGDVWSVDMAKGTVNWYYSTGSAGTETPYGVWPIWTFSVGTVADGKLFLGEGHMYSPPLFHNAQELVLDTATGQPSWSILAFDVTSAPAIADGIATTLNAYDNQIYAYGKGPSAITANAQQFGTSMVISGTIIDKSAGSQQGAVLGNFPTGLPCVSDNSMTGWMEYVYMQQPCPTNVTGVPITVSVVDSNGNSRIIGKTTSDASGMYTLTWIPDIPGNYTVTASFAGSNSYYGSAAETAFAVNAPTSTVTPTSEPISLASTQMYIVGIGVAVIIVVAIVGAMIMLSLRKRP